MTKDALTNRHVQEGSLLSLGELEDSLILQSLLLIHDGCTCGTLPGGIQILCSLCNAQERGTIPFRILRGMGLIVPRLTIKGKPVTYRLSDHGYKLVHSMTKRAMSGQ